MRRSGRCWAAVGLLHWFIGLAVGCGMTVAAPALHCSLRAPAIVKRGEPVLLQWQFSNPGAQAVQVLVWGTPFENLWTAPYVAVYRGDQALAYHGAMVKRGDPQADDYLVLAPGQARQATVDLSPAFVLEQAGGYRIEPQLHLHDARWAADGVLARPRAQHQGLELACNSVKLTVQP